MPIHAFDYTGTAYDACNCDDEIETGDTIVIEDEKVVALAWAWPIAVTQACGHLHTLKDGGNPLELDDCDGNLVFTRDHVSAAVAEARRLGFPIRPEFQSY